MNHNHNGLYNVCMRREEEQRSLWGRRERTKKAKRSESPVRKERKKREGWPASEGEVTRVTMPISPASLFGAASLFLRGKGIYRFIL